MPVLSLVYLNAEEKKELKYSDALFIYANRLPARYIPGGVWHSVSRGVDFHSFGMDINQIGRYFIIENVISLSMALLLGGILITLGQNYNLPVSIMLSFASLGLIMLLLLPVMLNRYFSHKDIKISEITIAQTVKGVLLTGAFWMIAGICFWQYILGFPISMDGLSYLDIAGSYIFSWAIGFIVIFAPQGIGITEFVATNIINVNVDLNVYLILVLGFRLVILSADLIMWSFIKLFLSKPINN
jgi:hypothetical protein